MSETLMFLVMFFPLLILLVFAGLAMWTGRVVGRWVDRRKK